MDVVALTRRLVDIPSVTGEEGAAAAFIAGRLVDWGFRVTRREVTPGRPNLFAEAGPSSDVVLCTHLDTVPGGPPSGSEDSGFIYGRGACDAKGPLAAMMVAGRELVESGFRRFALLFVVGEETTSDGARASAALNPGSRFLILGEPTGNKLALGHKGVLTLRLRTMGRAAHSAFPHLGESAIDRLLEVLQDIRAAAWPEDRVLGKTTVNIGKIEGGTAANVLAPDASATVLVRCAVSSRAVLDLVRKAVGGRAEVDILTEGSPVRFGRRPGFETTVLPFGSDAPYLGTFGEPFLLGPGNPEDAHTEGEKVAKRALEEAVKLYGKLVRDLADEPAGTEGQP